MDVKAEIVTEICLLFTAGILVANSSKQSKK